MDSIETLAELAANNWRDFDSFIWTPDNQEDETNDWMLYSVKNRDSGILEQANSDAIIEKFSDAFPDNENWHIETHNHW